MTDRFVRRRPSVFRRALRLMGRLARNVLVFGAALGPAAPPPPPPPLQVKEDEGDGEPDEER